MFSGFFSFIAGWSAFFSSRNTTKECSVLLTTQTVLYNCTAANYKLEEFDLVCLQAGTINLHYRGLKKT